MTQQAVQLPPFRAQFGEDRVLWQVFNQSPTGFFIEVGAYDGVTLSNTWFLEQMGWRGILVEPIRQLCEHAANARPGSRVYHAACSRPGGERMQKFTITQGVPVLSYLSADPDHVDRCVREGARLVEVEVPVITVDELLRAERHLPPETPSAWQAGRGWQIDLVSIDVEGGEMDVLEGFNLDRFKPRVLVMENDREAGAAIEPYLAARGYRKFHRQTINDFYARQGVATADLTLCGLKAE